MSDELKTAIEYMSSDDSVYGGGFIDYRTHAEVVLAHVKPLTAERDKLRAACEYVRRWLDEYDTERELHPSLRQTLDAALKQQ